MGRVKSAADDEDDAADTCVCDWLLFLVSPVPLEVLGMWITISGLAMSRLSGLKHEPSSLLVLVGVRCVLWGVGGSLLDTGRCW